MIEKFFTQPATLSRLQSGLLGPHLPAVTSVLEQLGYSTGSIRLHLRAADHFGTWLLEENIEVHDIDDTVVDRYLVGLGRQHSACSPEGRLPHTALGLRHLLEVLRHRGVVNGWEGSTAILIASLAARSRVAAITSGTPGGCWTNCSLTPTLIGRR